MHIFVQTLHTQMYITMRYAVYIDHVSTLRDIYMTYELMIIEGQSEECGISNEPSRISFPVVASTWPRAGRTMAAWGWTVCYKYFEII